MNKIYRVVWSTVHSAWVVVSELAKAGGKKTHSSRESTSDSTSSQSPCSQAITTPAKLTAVAVAVLAMFTVSQGVWADAGGAGGGCWQSGW